MMRKYSRYVVLSIVGMCLLVSSTGSFAFRSKNMQLSHSKRELQGAPAPVRPSKEKLLRVKSVQGLKVNWSERNGLPLSVVISNKISVVAQKLSVKGLAVKGVGDFNKDAIGVLDNVGLLYDIKDAENEFTVLSVKKSKRGFRHVKMAQKSKGLTVVGGSMLVHFDDNGKPFAVNGSYIANVQVNIEPVLTAEDALMVAQGDLFAWDKPFGAPTKAPELVVFARNMAPVLAYQMELCYDEQNGDPGRWRYWIDANTGAVLSSYNDIQRVEVDLHGRLLAGEGGADVTIKGEYDDFNVVYSMKSTNLFWCVRNSAGGRTGESYVDAIDAYQLAYRTDDNWTIPAPSYEDRTEVSAAKNIEYIQSYYRDVHNRISYNGLGDMMPVLVHVGMNRVDAFWSGRSREISIGDGDADREVASQMAVLDIIGHEFQHAVTEYSADLIYQYESGALNESFSDIFGTLVEFHSQDDGRNSYPGATPGRADWLMGEDAWLATTALRDMRNPSNPLTVGVDGRQPKFYKGEFWYFDDDDYGGVHQNNGVQNFFFYLLCEGGDDRNGGVDYHVPGVGITDGGELAYLTLTGYMTPDTDYHQAREAWLLAALELEDANDPASTHYYLSVAMAWSAVGIGSPDLVELEADTFVVFDVTTGDYMPSNAVYKVFNPYDVAHTWSITCAKPWAVKTPSSLIVAPFSYTNVNVAIVPLAPFPVGAHTNTIDFSNLTMPEKNTSRDIFLFSLRNYACVSTNYGWVDFDIFNGNENVFLVDNQVSQVYSLPFPVNFYLQSYSNFYISANGMVGFLPEGLEEYENADIPTLAKPNGMLCPYWDDLVPDVSDVGIEWGVVGTERLGNRRVVISWLDVAHAHDGDTKYSFQIVIPESGTNETDFIYNYRDVSQDDETLGSGLSATVGLDDPWGSFGLKYSYNGSTWLANHQSLLMTAFPPVDSVRPTGVISVVDWTTSSIEFEIRFDEIVEGFTIDDVVIASSAQSAPYSSAVLRGGGERYLLDVTGITDLGTVVISLSQNLVSDLAGNGNIAINEYMFVMPVFATVFEDDMEDGIGFWTESENVFEYIRSDVWEYGVPTFTNGPPAAYSGSNCWGTVLDGNSSFGGMNTRAWLTSPSIEVGDKPVLSFAVWYSISHGLSQVEVEDEHGWHVVASYEGDSGGWQKKEIWLDNDQYGNGTIKVRFSVWDSSGPGLYIDDVSVRTKKDDGLCVVDVSTVPGTITPSSTVGMNVELYNSGTVSRSAVLGNVASLTQGVTVDATSLPIEYGSLLPGQSVLSSSPVQFSVGNIDSLNGPKITLVHDAEDSAGATWSEFMYLDVPGVPLGAGSNFITVVCTQGVVDWTNTLLAGDGSLSSCLFQLIYAGDDAEINPPTTAGMTTGDDLLLYSQGDASTSGRFGEGPDVSENLGQFKKMFRHTLSTNDVVYVRAWDSYSFVDSVAYGDSLPYTILDAPSQTNVFAQWIVGTAPSPSNDYNGDSIPDAWCITNGLDPRDPTGVALDATWTYAGIKGTPGDSLGQYNAPKKVAIKDDFAFVLDSGNNRVQVFDRVTFLPLLSYGSSGATDGHFSFPNGMALDPRPGIDRIVVADTHNNRIQMLSFDAATTNISFLWSVGFPEIAGDGAGDYQLENPCGVAIGNSGDVYVADTGNGVFSDHSRIMVYDANGIYIRTLAAYGTVVGAVQYPEGLCVTSGEVIIVADTANNRVQGFASSGANLWTVGSLGTNDLQFSHPRDVQVGPYGRIYVADTDNSRLQLLDPSRTHLGTFGAFGYGAGDLHHPYGLWPSTGTNAVYVADTYNNRIQLFNIVVDADGDGMNDIWEDAYGLDSPLGDADGDGLVNLGEYRSGLNPTNPDTDGDGVNDGDEVGAVGNSIPIPPYEISVQMVGSVVNILWNVETGVSYAVEYTENLVDGIWTQSGGLITPAFAGVYAWQDTMPPPAGGSRFYRIVRFDP